MKKGLVLLMVLGLPGLVLGGGYEFGGLGARAIGMGGAFVGLADDWTAIYWNPAGLANLSGRGIGSYLEYAKLDGKDGDSVANFLNPYSTEPTRFTKKEIETSAILPSLGWWQKRNGFTLAGGLYTPNGNAIDWKDGMKDAIMSADINASYHTLLFISAGNISCAKEVTDNLSIGAGLNLLYSKFEVEAKKSYSTATASFYNYDFVNKVSGDGTGLEGVAGFLLRPSDKLSIGGVARSGSLLKLEGEGEGSLQGTITGTLIEKSNYTQNFSYPATLGLGTAYRLTPKMTITCDLARTYWSSMKEDIDFDLDTGSSGSHTTKFLQDKDKSLNWSNTDRFRMGFEYKPDEVWSLRAGFFFSPSPVPADGVDITKLIDVDCRFLTAGVGYKRLDWQVDFAYVNSSGKETLSGVEYKKNGNALGVTGRYRF
ncbi:outer membrane protein transport protein [bacterium]|nr:outer membrane protein transport protein [bacterium]